MDRPLHPGLVHSEAVNRRALPRHVFLASVEHSSDALIVHADVKTLFSSLGAILLTQRKNANAGMKHGVPRMHRGSLSTGQTDFREYRNPPQDAPNCSAACLVSGLPIRQPLDLYILLGVSSRTMQSERKAIALYLSAETFN